MAEKRPMLYSIFNVKKSKKTLEQFNDLSSTDSANKVTTENLVPKINNGDLKFVPGKIPDNKKLKASSSTTPHNLHDIALFVVNRRLSCSEITNCLKNTYNIFIPFLDQIISELRTRFDERLKEIIPLEGLIPSHFGKYDNATILSVAKIYENDLPLNASITLKAELLIWQNQWKVDGQNCIVSKPETAIDTLPYCTDIAT